MVDFNQFSNAQLVQFVDEHFELFASERDEAFPENVLSELDRDTCAIARRAEGFAIAYKGRRYRFGTGSVPADLMFLYVRPESTGNGVGKALVETIKHSVTPGVPILLMCEGARRKDFFGRLGFHVTEYSEDGDLYEMQWIAAASDAT